MKDYFTLVFISGFTGGVVKDLLDAFSFYVLRFVRYRYLDFAAIIIYGKSPFFWWDTTLAQLTELIFCGLLALPFAYLLKRFKSDNLVFKGGLYGTSLWIFLYTLGYIFKFKYLTDTHWKTSTSDMITSTIYGIVLAIALKKFTAKNALKITGE